MDLSDTQHLSTPAPIQGDTSLFSVAAVSSDSTSKIPNRRATPRKIPGVSTKSTKRGYDKADREKLGTGKGSLVGMLMLGQLRHDFEPDKNGNPAFAQREHNGHYWVAYSLAYWTQQIGVTKREARSGIECLVASGLVVVANFEFGNQDSYTHFRLTEKALGYAPAKPGGCAIATHPVPSGHTLCHSDTPTTPIVSPVVSPVEGLQIGPAELLQTGAEAPCSTPTRKDENQPGQGKSNSVVLEKDSAPGSSSDTSPGDSWQYYNELAAVYDMDELLAVLQESGYLPAHWKMVPEKECRILWPLHLQISKSVCDEDDLISTLRAFSAPVGVLPWETTWNTFCDVVQEQNPKVDTTPAHPNLLFLKKHFATFEAYCIAMEAEKAAAA